MTKTRILKHDFPVHGFLGGQLYGTFSWELSWGVLEGPKQETQPSWMLSCERFRRRSRECSRGRTGGLTRLPALCIARLGKQRYSQEFAFPSCRRSSGELFGSQRSLRDILMPRGKNWLPTVSRQFLTLNYPRPNCLLKCLPNCLSPTVEDIFSSFKSAPVVRVIARQLSGKNCLAAIFASRHQDASPGPLGLDSGFNPSFCNRRPGADLFRKFLGNLQVIIGHWKTFSAPNCFTSAPPKFRKAHT